MLCAVPALRALRSAYPSARITLVGLPWARKLVDRYPLYIDEVVEFPGFPGLPEREPESDALPAFFSEVRERDADLAIQLHGSGEVTNPLVARFGARSCAGFYDPSSSGRADGTFIPWPRTGYEAQRLLALVSALGIETRGDDLEFPVREDDEAELRTLAREGGWSLTPSRYVCIHPGARKSSRRWAPDRFAVVADALAERGLQVVLTGTTSERAITDAVAAAMRHPAVDAAGPMSLGALAALMRDARFVVSNDTGVSHLAAALRVPSVIVFLAADPDRWAPLDESLHRALYDAESCVPQLEGARDVGRACEGGIFPEDVLAELDLLPLPGRAHAA
ncbi:MAG TPA: glycosyltransferase family 9 protein [Gemmatimonadaceae bacterium]|jgi:ADP-heptose:LPS heptosyltransferase|nr:glycosyltransferase family 9 protein [Gemmatimonadaceae bacterium]